MKTTFDCIPCIVSHVVQVAKMVTEDDDERHEIIKRTLAEAVNTNLNMTPPEQARLFHKIIKEITGVHDPYLDAKDRSTEFALELLPLLREEIKRHDNEFEAVVRLVIGGNIIDYGADHAFDIKDAKRRILEVFDMQLDLDEVEKLHEQLERADKVFYMADNCGEAVFDRLLIERYDSKITLGVRGEPILNDITPREIKRSGLNMVPHVHTGDMTPGVSMTHSSPEFLNEIRNADLVVSKGQGNFETLNEYDRPIFFLLRVKCAVIADLIGNAQLGDLQVISKNI
ncbi:ARMT1-like domain-containing protein [Lentisphaerota bacterium ZTH]|nr:DUF89 family protein [Lentisphaerota bacterium]WET05507.1 ARMT1-like domain-containing protein [Lentisphaerota bacterium ZTH]